MGVLRLLLALTVVIHHAGPFHGLTFTGGQAAVQTFYMISGFYIFLILNEKYVGKDTLGTFYFNRFLRLFPAYWIVLAVTLAISALGWTALPGGSLLYHWKDWYAQLSWQTVVFGVFTNLSIFFQDLVMFMAVDPATGLLKWTSNFWWEAKPAWHLLIVPQAWSLGVELLFYLVAPWLLRRPVWQIGAVAVASLALRAQLVRGGLAGDPWSTRFFPTELFFFCVGGLACAFYRSRVRKAATDPRLLAAIVIAVIGLTLSFQFIPVFNLWKDNAWGYYAVVALALPFLFKATEKSRLDSFIGDLSYPVYISHFIVMRIIGQAGKPLDEWVGEILFWTLACSYGLVVATRPFEKLRLKKAEAMGRKKVAKPRKAPSKKRVPVAAET